MQTVRTISGLTPRPGASSDGAVKISCQKLETRGSIGKNFNVTLRITEDDQWAANEECSAHSVATIDSAHPEVAACWAYDQPEVRKVFHLPQVQSLAQAYRSHAT